MNATCDNIGLWRRGGWHLQETAVCPIIKKTKQKPSYLNS